MVNFTPSHSDQDGHRKREQERTTVFEMRCFAGYEFFFEMPREHDKYIRLIAPCLCFGNDGNVCSLGDGSITEGEVAEAFQMAVLKKLPILYVIQDNGWDISASADEIRAQDATFFAKGFGRSII